MWSTGKSKPTDCNPWVSRAFTLVELTVVIVVITVLASFAAPQMFGAFGKAQLRESARDLAAAARFAHDFAATRRRMCRIAFDAEGRSWRLEMQTKPNTEPSLFEVIPIGPIKTIKLPDNVKLAQMTVDLSERALPGRDQHAIVFEPSGRADAALIQLTDGKQIFSLLISAMDGHVTLVNGVIEQPPIEREDLDA